VRRRASLDVLIQTLKIESLFLALALIALGMNVEVVRRITLCRHRKRA
jgi:hypothetical protein